MEKKKRKVYKRSLAKQLIQKGCKILSAYPNPKHPKMKVYIFEETEDFNKLFSEVVEENRLKLEQELLNS